MRLKKKEASDSNMDEAPVEDEPSASAKEIQMEVTANVNAQVGDKLDDINEREIEQVLSLNLTVWPRLNRGGDGIVTVRKRKQLNERERLMAIQRKLSRRSSTGFKNTTRSLRSLMEGMTWWRGFVGRVGRHDWRRSRCWGQLRK